MDKISLIIPVYNVEDYIGKCLDSVINQTYSNLEILLIDDGSTDDSGKICDEYAKKDARIKVFHKDNGGNTAIPRNVGMNNMTGKYVSFVDSDDYIEPDMFEILYNAIIQNEGVDVSVCSYYKETATSSTKIVNREQIKEKLISTKDMLLYPLMRDYYMGFCGYLWNKLFRADLLDGLRLDESIKYASDVLFYTKLVARGNVIGTYVEKPLYHYIVSRSGAVTKSESVAVKADILRSYKGIEELLDSNGYSDISYWARGFYCYHASVVAELALKKHDTEMLTSMQEEIRKHYDDYKRTNKDFPEKFEKMESLMNCKPVNFPDKISIIIPIYNVEACIGKCLDSVTGQTYDNLEILVIDDGSTDDSGRICDEYAKKDARIRVFHKENGGVSSARNLGLDNMTGKYTGLVDGDDYIEPDMFETLYRTIAKTEGADVAVCSYFYDTVSGSTKIENIKRIKDKVISTKNMLIYSFKNPGFSEYLWNKLFKADLFRGLRFDESIKYGENFLLYHTLIVTTHAKGVHTEKPLYHYYKRSNAITELESYDIKADILKVYELVEELFNSNGYSDISYWARGIFCYYASVIAGLAQKKRDAKMLLLMQEQIRKHYDSYRRIGRHLPQKTKTVKKLADCKLVNFCEYDIERFTEQVGDKSIVCFGGYNQFDVWCAQNSNMVNKIKVIIDNDTSIHGTFSRIGELKIPIVSLNKFLKMKITNYVILINTNRHSVAIVKQLDLSGKLEGVDVYVAEMRPYKDNGVLRKMQMIQLEVLDEFARVCDKHNLKYYLFYGALLGAVRHKGFVPWDDDIDVLMPYCDFEQLTRLPPEEFSNGCSLYWITSDSHYEGNLVARFHKDNTFFLMFSDEFGKDYEKSCRIGLDIFPRCFTKKEKSFLYKYKHKYHIRLERIMRYKSGRNSTKPRSILLLLSIKTLMAFQEKFRKLFNDTESGYFWGAPSEEVFGEGVPMEFEGKIYNAPSDWNFCLQKQYGKDYMELPPPDKRFSHCPRKLSFDLKSGIYEDV